MQADLIQNDEMRCTTLAVFGAARSSVLNKMFVSAPENISAPEQLPEFPFIEGIIPGLTKMFDMRWAKGSYPFAGSKEEMTGIWIAFREQQEAALAHLIAIADIPPTPALSMITKPSPASSLTWSFEILDDDFVADAHGWWYVETSVEQAAHGYVQQNYKILAPGGRLVALARQVAVIFG